MLQKGLKESRMVNISVEGVNCERLYFEHVATLINSSGENTYNLKVNVQKALPFEYAKRNAYRQISKFRKKDIPYIHIQDIEDYSDTELREKFHSIIDNMRKAEREFGITYKLGYSNYSFDLWMLLHVADMNFQIPNRNSYLVYINRYFNSNFHSMDEFKKETAFKSILNDFVTIDSIRNAITRAERICSKNFKQKQKTQYKKVEFYAENPDTFLHEIIKLLFSVCKIK